MRETFTDQPSRLVRLAAAAMTSVVALAVGVGIGTGIAATFGLV